MSFYLESWIRIAQANGQVCYHISNNLFDDFDVERSQDGLIWFSKDKESLLESGHGASIGSGGNVYLYTCLITSNNPASYDEYDRYFVQQLEQMGYDSLDLDDDFVVFYPENIEILDVEKVTVTL